MRARRQPRSPSLRPPIPSLGAKAREPSWVRLRRPQDGSGDLVVFRCAIGGLDRDSSSGRSEPLGRSPRHFTGLPRNVVGRARTHAPGLLSAVPRGGRALGRKGHRTRSSCRSYFIPQLHAPIAWQGAARGCRASVRSRATRRIRSLSALEGGNKSGGARAESTPKLSILWEGRRAHFSPPSAPLTRRLHRCRTRDQPGPGHWDEGSLDPFASQRHRGAPNHVGIPVGARQGTGGRPPRGSSPRNINPPPMRPKWSRPRIL